MASAIVTVYFQTKATQWEVDLAVTGTVERGGSNSYGSDEPAWCAVDVADVTLPNGKPLPRRMRESLTAKDWEHIEDALIEAW